MRLPQVDLYSPPRHFVLCSNLLQGVAIRGNLISIYFTSWVSCARRLQTYGNAGRIAVLGISLQYRSF